MLKESGLFSDFSHVQESELLGMFAKAHASANKVSTVEREWINQEIEKRLQAKERRFGIDMVPEI